MKREMQRPSLGCAFDPDQRNEREIVEAYISELEWYRPRGFAKLRSEGVKLLNKEDDHEDWQWSSEWMVDCDNLLTEHAQHCGLQHFIYGPFEHGGAVGYYVNIEGAKEDADFIVDDLSEIPAGFSGFVLCISDHGNVSAYSYSRGKAKELWAVV